jgi:hypothetical protein
LQILWRHRFLEPGNVEILDLPSDTDRGYRVVSVVGVNHDCHGFADGPTDRSAEPNVLVDAEA